MRTTGTSSNLADSVVLTLRWLVIVGMVIAIATSRELSGNTLTALIFLVIWNCVLSLLALGGIYISKHRQVSLVVDFSAALLIFFDNGGLYGPVAWAVVLPLLTAGLYFRWVGSLTVAGLMLLIHALWTGVYQGGWGWQALQALPGSTLLDTVLPLALGGVLTGIAIGWLSRRVPQQGQAAPSGQATQPPDEDEVRQAEHERMRSFYHMMEMLGATLNYQMVLEKSIELCADVLAEDSLPVREMVGAVLLLDQNVLRVGAARNFNPSDHKQIFPMERGALYKLAHSGEAILIQEPYNDAELGQISALGTCQVALALPLRRGLVSYGAMLFAHPDPNFFTSESCEMLELITQQAVIAIQNAQLYLELQEERDRILDNQDEVRKKLARDLHDGPTQSVSAIAMGLSIARKQLEHDPAQAAEDLERLEVLARRTAEEIRHMLFTLRPLVLETEGLAEALRTMGEKVRETYHQNVVVEADPEVAERIDESKQTVLFYLAEEAINNARKHAHASKVTVRLSFVEYEDCVGLLEISDDGVGFDLSQVTSTYQQRGSLGLVNLRERAEMVNGVLKIDSAPGKGTRVSVRIPLNDSPADLLKRRIVTVPVPPGSD